jgi:2-keto-4-pentenoate hydratase/2-oxohepta-3-ene-1,7-dioic acid hydratase in catechol pathway
LYIRTLIFHLSKGTVKIFAVGMNYLQHNKELDGTLYKPETPVIFTKADSSLLKDHKPFFVPDWSAQVDYETEVVVRICRLGKSIPVQFAHRYYDAVTVGIDFTARDMQREARQKGLPWEICKGFDGSAVIGDWVAKDLLPDIQALHFHLDISRKDGSTQETTRRTVQEGCTADMLYTVDELISYISRYFTLKTGDLLYTGTPVGVGPVQIDDHLEGWLEGRKVLEFNCK